MVSSVPTILPTPGSNPKHIIYAFFELYLNFNEKRMKINKKEVGIGQLINKKTSIIKNCIKIIISKI